MLHYAFDVFVVDEIKKSTFVVENDHYNDTNYRTGLYSSKPRYTVSNNIYACKQKIVNRTYNTVQSIEVISVDVIIEKLRTERILYVNITFIFRQQQINACWVF